MTPQLRLARLHAALQAGDFAALADASDQMDLIEAEARALSKEGLADLRRQALDFSAHLMASARGIRSAMTRIAELRAVREGMQSYGPRGERRRDLAPPQASRRF